MEQQASMTASPAGNHARTRPLTVTYAVSDGHRAPDLGIPCRTGSGRLEVLTDQWTPAPAGWVITRNPDGTAGVFSPGAWARLFEETAVIMGAGTGHLAAELAERAQPDAASGCLRSDLEELAKAWEASADATAPSRKSEIEREHAAALRVIAERPF